MRRLAAALVAALVAVMPAPALAWWEYGHEMVAAVAMRSVTPRTRAAIRDLLRHQGLMRTPTCPARTLEEASVWADCIKPLGDRFSYIYSWHYENVDVCKPFDLTTPCADGNCVSSQIERAARMLHDPRLPLRDRVEALLLLTHFMGDISQPMHAGDRGDRGGNDLAADYGLIGGRTNLHSIWDGLLPERALSTPPAAPDGLLAGLGAEERARLQAGSVEDWARDGWQVAHDLAYAPLLSGDACALVPQGMRPRLSQEQIAALVPAVRRQVEKGGLRLARLLDEALGGTAPAPGSPLLPKPRG
ncbi:S1/P1 nuclease [Sphingomonas quercus]|uniref:S1/P1 nuclease n=1 Tax=Sphingomonas quercus TaxID=2842451 RepID=A0ABS6BEX4_9SPHN|nr:S1/P1 nuclease [Sphingomonas quercus]MBU3076860.1 S1/P1 nuclease [Sphingomonas quercus]